MNASHLIRLLIGIIRSLHSCLCLYDKEQPFAYFTYVMLIIMYVKNFLKNNHVTLLPTKTPFSTPE